MSEVFSGDIARDTETLRAYRTDASIFSITPQAVYFPKHEQDVVTLVKTCLEDRAHGGDASLTVRAGGTCMSGGSLTSGWVVDLTRHMSAVEVDPVARTATVELGAQFRDIEDMAKQHGLMFAPYPSSHRICGIGGMIGNNASGEKSLRNGATSDNVLSLRVVLADGTVLDAMQKPRTSPTSVYEQRTLALAEQFGEKLTAARGDVKKAASGYRLENVLHDDSFSLVPLMVGAQGTLGIITKAVLKLVPIPTHTKLLVISTESVEDLPQIIDTVNRHNPEGLETFDSNTLRQAEKHLTSSFERFIPYVAPEARVYILAQFSEATLEETEARSLACEEALLRDGFFVQGVEDAEAVDAAWDIRRHAFLLMRDYNEHGHKAVPCIEDVIVPLPALGVFVYELSEILARRGLFYGFHGHIGDGSLRVIPVFDMTRQNIANEIMSLMDEVFVLIKKLHGNISADHSDGIIRSPFLRQFYGTELYAVFEEVKRVFDPLDIMNPKKKVVQNADQIGICIDCD